jgi:hypothetical protein
MSLSIQKSEEKIMPLLIQKSTTKTIPLPFKKLAAKNCVAIDSEISNEILCRC